MPPRSLLTLFLLSLTLQISVSRLQTIPGYLDADYYYMGGVQLAKGEGFNEPFLWNYLDDPAGIPHPSHGYWFPLASIVSALGMWLTGTVNYESGRIFFIALASLVPPLTAALSYRFFQNTAFAWVSGLLALFPGFHLPFLPAPDNYGIYMIAGGLLFYIADRPRPWFWMGLLAGILSLARSDGLLWLALTFLFILWRVKDEKLPFTSLIQFCMIAFFGFIIVMGPWYARNLSVFGSVMSPAGSKALWLTTYEETFIYPASQLTFDSWIASGWKSILEIRWWSFRTNLMSAIAAQGHLILFPFIVVGMIQMKKDRRVQLGVTAWAILFIVMTFIFPFAGVRGSFFHAGAALQPLFWTLAPFGLEHAVAWARKKNRFTDHAYVVFRIALVQIVIMLSAWVVWARVIQNGWDEGELDYPAVEQFLLEQGAQPGDSVIALSSPGYAMMTGRPAYAQPAGGIEAIVQLAERYDIEYFVFQEQGAVESLRGLYDNPQGYEQIQYLGSVNEIRVFRIP